MAKNKDFSLTTWLGILILLSCIIYYHLTKNESNGSKSDESESNESESNGLNNKMSGLAANCYDINKPVTLNDQYTKNIACKNVPPPANNRMRVNYYNSGE
jgi:hypothetical protein